MKLPFTSFQKLNAPTYIFNSEKALLAYMNIILHISEGIFLGDLMDNTAKKSICY
jgi:hypothetical protein